jgi:Zn-dependent M28 family amino/carboxypeptidase
MVYLNLSPKTIESFNGERAYQDVIYQVNLGPRIPGSLGHDQAVEWMTNELDKARWQTEVLEQPFNGLTARNVVAKRGNGATWIILGAHYDTRHYADRDPNPDNHTQPVVGANDGASGVAVLLELARSLPADLDKEIWLVFFDIEDQGGINGRNYIEGSTAFAQSLETNPTSVIIVDMVGDRELNIHYERNSDFEIMQQIWDTAAGLGYGNVFIPSYKYSMLDDHTPFLQRGIRAVDIIDFDNPTYHTIADTPENVSAESLTAVGTTLWTWLHK